MKKHLEKIDFLRGVAAFMVFLYHCQYNLYPEYVTGYNTNGFLNINSFKILILNCSPTAIGGTGVELFLILSGFLIHLAYLKKNSSFKISTFYSKRFWRIYPPYFLILIFLTFSLGGIGSFIFHFREVYFDFFTHLLLIHNLFDSSFFTINGSFWTLGLEMQLYLIYPVLLYFRAKLGMRSTFLVTIVVSLVWTLVEINFKYLGNSLAFSASCINFWFVWTAGAYYAELFKKNMQIFRKNGLPISVLFLLLMMASRFNIYSNYLFIYLATAFYVIFLDWFLFKKSLNGTSFVYKSFVALGLCSYSFYLIHQPYLNGLFNHFSIVSNNHTYYRILNIIPVFMVLYLISYFLYHLIELKSVEYGKRFRLSKTDRLR